MTDDVIVNKVASSPLITFDLGEYYDTGERVVYDLAQNLYQGLMLKEKDFRNFIKENDWSYYAGKNVAITCSADAIVPTWAYMLLAIKLEPEANFVAMGDMPLLEYALFQQALAKVDLEKFRNQPIVIKGCGDLPVPESAYVEITRLIRPYAKSIMYGEPCSTVPLYKLKRPIKTDS